MNMEVLGQLAADSSIVDNKFEKSAGPLGAGLRMLGRGFAKSPIATLGGAGLAAGAMNDAAAYTYNPFSKSKNWSPVGTEWNPGWHSDRISNQNPNIFSRVGNAFGHPLQTLSAFLNPENAGSDYREVNRNTQSKYNPATGKFDISGTADPQYRPGIQYQIENFRQQGMPESVIHNWVNQRAHGIPMSGGQGQAPSQATQGRPNKPGVPSNPFRFAPVFSYYND